MTLRKWKRIKQISIGHIQYNMVFYFKLCMSSCQPFTTCMYPCTTPVYNRLHVANLLWGHGVVFLLEVRSDLKFSGAPGRPDGSDGWWWMRTWEKSSTIKPNSDELSTYLKKPISCFSLIFSTIITISLFWMSRGFSRNSFRSHFDKKSCWGGCN